MHLVDGADWAMDAFNVERLTDCISDTVPTSWEAALADKMNKDVVAVGTDNLNVNTHGLGCLIRDNASR